MGSAITNIANVQQQFMNNITQVDQQNCISVSKTTQNNNIFILNGSNISGNFTGVTNTVNTDASCLIVSNMQDSISNILSATLSQTNLASTDIFSALAGFTDETNVFNINQTVTNNISQINQATCAANTTVSQSDNYFYVGNTNIGGNFLGVTSDAHSSANCSMSNTMKNTTYNQAQATGNQSNTVQGMFATIFGSFAAIIIIIAIGTAILHSTGAINHVGLEPAKEPGPSEDETELKAVQDLGITPTQLSALAKEPV